jgi:glyoxylase-like metal-dependent hydrolase (beta-lactamase superfamily II)
MELIQLNEHTWVIQGGANIGETLFVGDAFLTPDILDKHRIPFYTDIQAGLTTLAALKKQTPTFKHIVAGHGEIYTTAEQANRAIEYMEQRLESIMEEVRRELAHGTPRALPDILAAVASAQKATISTLSQHVLYQTTVQSALSTLYTRGEISPLFQNNTLLWARGKKVEG